MTTIASAHQTTDGWQRFLARGGIVLVCLPVVVLGTALAEPRFLNRLNLLNVMRNFAFLLLPSLAQMLVMTTGGFDLSVGAVMACASLVTALAMVAASAVWPGLDAVIVLLALMAALALGGLVGAVNGALVAVLRLSPFMVTLAVASILMGAALYATQGIPVYGILDGYIQYVGRAQLWRMPVILLIALAVLTACAVLQQHTVLGRHLYAVGSNARSARLSGVPVVRTVVTAYTLAGMLAALTGFLMTSRIGSGQALIGTTLALETIAAAVIGGVSLAGGVARAGQVAAAALFLTVIANAMNLLRVESKWQTLMLGVVLIVALALERWFWRRS